MENWISFIGCLYGPQGTVIFDCGGQLNESEGDNINPRADNVDLEAANIDPTAGSINPETETTDHNNDALQPEGGDQGHWNDISKTAAKEVSQTSDVYQYIQMAFNIGYGLTIYIWYLYNRLHWDPEFLDDKESRAEQFCSSMSPEKHLLKAPSSQMQAVVNVLRMWLKAFWVMHFPPIRGGYLTASLAIYSPVSKSGNAGELSCLGFDFLLHAAGMYEFYFSRPVQFKHFRFGGIKTKVTDDTAILLLTLSLGVNIGSELGLYRKDRQASPNPPPITSVGLRAPWPQTDYSMTDIDQAFALGMALTALFITRCNGILKLMKTISKSRTVRTASRWARELFNYPYMELLGLINF